MNDAMKFILAGALTMGFVIAGLFFLRFWRKTRDRLFALFALSFFAMGLNRIILALLSAQSPGGVRGPWHDRMYWVRLVAFLLILLAILDKNRSPRPSAPRPP
jgi:alpha-D-ribose 1-methylphosphonate 5-triphosphate synthase subunit PhnI